MPVYVIEFVASDARPQQRRFTLDDDLPLRPQVEHVLAELERGGTVLRGGPGDELTVRWAGQEVDATRSPAALGVTPDRAVELRMQRRRAPVVVQAPPPPPEAPATPFTPRGVYASAALGAAGAWTAGILAGTIADGPADGTGPLGAHAGLNGILAAAFGLVVGAAVGAGSARRENKGGIAGALFGGGAGLAAALFWAAAAAWVGDWPPDAAAGNLFSLQVVAVRAGALAVLAAMVAVGVSLAAGPSVAGVSRQITALRAAGWTGLAGFVAGLIPGVPGPVELWDALAIVLLGAVVGAAVVWPVANRATGVVSLEARGDRGPGVLSLREWALGDGSAVTLPDEGVAGPVVAAAGGAFTQTTPGGAARPLRQDDRVTVGAARFRFRRLPRRAVAVLVLALAAAGATARAQRPFTVATGGQASPPRYAIEHATLVRCVADRPLPCVQLRVAVPGDVAAADALTAGTADGERPVGWSGRLGPYLLEPVQVRATRAGGPRRVVLTLVDVSGSMRGEGMQVARAALRAFLRDLGAGADPGSVQAALGSFASRGVAAGVRGGAFADPETVAGGVDLLPAPGGNTGLYSAVALGAARVAEAARAAGDGTRAALVVVTDGVNDVTDAAGRPRADDDPGLLRGPEGRAAAADTARRLGVDLYLVGVGQEPDMNELRALAGDSAHAFRTARDAVALREALARVDASLAPTREVLFAIPGAERASLARPEWALTVTHEVPSGVPGGRSAAARRTTYVGAWPVPTVGLPVFAGEAFRADGRGPAAPAWLRAAAAETPAVSRAGLVGAFTLALVAIAWALPRALWRPAPAPVEGAGGGAGGVPAVTSAPVRQLPLRPVPEAAAAAVAGGGGVAAGVREAPPRRPDDVTAQRVRRDGTRPASGARV